MWPFIEKLSTLLWCWLFFLFRFSPVWFWIIGSFVFCTLRYERVIGFFYWLHVGCYMYKSQISICNTGVVARLFVNSCTFAVAKLGFFCVILFLQLASVRLTSRGRKELHCSEEESVDVELRAASDTGIASEVLFNFANLFASNEEYSSF